MKFKWVREGSANAGEITMIGPLRQAEGSR